MKGNREKGEPGSPAYYLTFAFKIMRYAGILILLVMSAMDFVGAIAAQDNDAVKKAVSKLLIRAVLCVILFLLPLLVEFLLKFFTGKTITLEVELSDSI